MITNDTGCVYHTDVNRSSLFFQSVEKVIGLDCVCFSSRWHSFSCFSCGTGSQSISCKSDQWKSTDMCTLGFLCERPMDIDVFHHESLKSDRLGWVLCIQVRETTSARKSLFPTTWSFVQYCWHFLFLAPSFFCIIFNMTPVCVVRCAMMIVQCWYSCLSTSRETFLLALVLSIFPSIFSCSPHTHTHTIKGVLTPLLFFIDLLSAWRWKRLTNGKRRHLMKLAGVSTERMPNFVIIFSNCIFLSD